MIWFDIFPDNDVDVDNIMIIMVMIIGQNNNQAVDDDIMHDDGLMLDNNDVHDDYI